MPTICSAFLVATLLEILLPARPAFGQKDAISPNKNELGISLLSYASRPSGHLRFNQTFHTYPVRGLSYRRYLNRSAIRFSVARQKITKKQPIPENWNTGGDYAATLVRVGWERSFTTDRLSSYAAVDMVSIWSLSNGYFGGGFIGAYHDFTTERWGLGISPALGMRYRPFRWVSLFAETSLDVLYSHRRGDYIQVWPDTAKLPYSENIRGFEGKFNPLASLTVNVVF